MSITDAAAYNCKAENKRGCFQVLLFSFASLGLWLVQENGLVTCVCSVEGGNVFIAEIVCSLSIHDGVFAM